MIVNKFPLYYSLSKTVLERMGGYPKYFLDGSGYLSDRNVRKKIIAEKIRAKHQRSLFSIES